MCTSNILRKKSHLILTYFHRHISKCVGISSTPFLRCFHVECLIGCNIICFTASIFIYRKQCLQYRYFIDHLSSWFLLINFNWSSLFILWMMQLWLPTRHLLMTSNSSCISFRTCSCSNSAIILLMVKIV